MLDSKEQSLSDKSRHIDERELQVKQLEVKKAEELEKIASLSQEQARGIILSETEKNLAHDIANRIKEAEREIKDRTDKTAKDLLAQAMQRLAGDYVAEQTITTVHLLMIA